LVQKSEYPKQDREPHKPFTLARIVEEEAKATNFVNNVLMPELQKRVDENPPRPLMEGKSGEELVQAQGV
jgi:hypothetical protein